MRRSGEAARAMQRACEVCEACAEVFVRAVHTPRVYYAHAWEGQPEVLVHARGVECQEVPGGASVKKVPGGSVGRTLNTEHAVSTAPGCGDQPDHLLLAARTWRQRPPPRTEGNPV